MQPYKGIDSQQYQNKRYLTAIFDAKVMLSWEILFYPMQVSIRTLTKSGTAL